MNIIEPELLLLVAAGVAAITVILGVLVIAPRVNKVREQLGELQSSIQAIESEVAQIAKIVDPMSDTLPQLVGFGLNFRQISSPLCESRGCVSNRRAVLASPFR